MSTAELCAEAAAQEIERGGERWDGEQAGLVERLARIISEYPDDWDWRKANAEQRLRYDRIAKAVLAIVCAETAPHAQAVERARCLAVLDDMASAAESRRKGHHATPWLKHAREAVASGIDPRELADGILHADNAETD